MKLCSRPRRAVTVVENTLVLPALFLLVIGFIVAALGVFRYEELASLAREGARYASVRGYSYEVATGEDAATPAEVFNNAIKPKVVALDADHLSYSVTWDPDNRQGNLVSVELTYRWIPEVFFGGVDIKSKSTMPMSY
jgi:hypothetical protein